jgi:hypothetical protein
LSAGHRFRPCGFVDGIERRIFTSGGILGKRHEPGASLQRLFRHGDRRIAEVAQDGHGIGQVGSAARPIST